VFFSFRLFFKGISNIRRERNRQAGAKDQDWNSAKEAGISNAKGKLSKVYFSETSINISIDMLLGFCYYSV